MSRPHGTSALWAIGVCFALALFFAPGASANGWGSPAQIATDEVIFPQLGMAADEGALAVWHEYDGCSCQTIHTAEMSPGGSFVTGPSLDGGRVDDHTGLRLAENGGGDAVAAWGRYGDGVTRVALRPAGGSWSTPVAIEGTAPIGLGIDEAGNATVAVLATVANQGSAGTHRAVQVVTHLAGADASAWSGPVTVSVGDTSVARGSSAPAVRLAVAPDGDATLAWEPGMETAVVETSERRSPTAAWSTPQVSLSGHGSGNQAVLSLAVASGGRAAIVWGSGAYGVENDLMVREASGEAFGSPVESFTGTENAQVAIAGDGRLTVAGIEGCADHNRCGSHLVVETKPAGAIGFGPTQTLETDVWYSSLSLKSDASGTTVLAWVSGFFGPANLKASVLAPGDDEFPPATDLGAVGTTGNVVNPALAMSGEGSAVVSFGNPPLYATYDGRQADPPTVVTGTSSPGDGSGSNPQTARVVDGSYATNACTVRGAGDGTSLRVAYQPAASFDGSHYGGATAWVKEPYAAEPATGEFTQTLTGLAPETIYHYRIEGKNECAGLTASASGEDATFTTAGRNDQPLTFTVLADGAPFAAGSHFRQGAVVHIEMNCSVPPPRSVALCEHPDTLETSRPGGPFTFTVRAADDVGRQSTATFGYFVDPAPPASQSGHKAAGPTDRDGAVSPGARGGQAIGTTKDLPPAIDGSKLASGGGAIIDIEALIPNTTLIQGSGLISDKGLGLTSGTLASAITAGGGNLIAAGGGNVIAAGGGNVIAAGGGNVIAAGGGNLVAAGGGNVIAAGGGNRPQLLIAGRHKPRRGKRRQMLLFDAGHRFAAPGHAKLHLRPTKQGRKLFRAYEQAVKIARRHHHEVKPLKLAVTTIVGPYEVGHGVAEYATRIIKIKP